MRTTLTHARSLKLKRPQTVKAFRTEIDRMYEEIVAQMPASKSKL
jgi:long-chain acyl-CoA synthetase